MSVPVIDRTFASSVESELSAIGSRASRLERSQRRARSAAIAAGGLIVIGALSGASVIVNGWPGERTITPVGEVVASGTYTGNAIINLGPIPADAAFVVLDIECESGGEMKVNTGTAASPAWASWNCSDELFDGTAHIMDGRLPAKGSTEVEVSAAPGTEWSLEARFATSVTAPLGVNAKGETYGALVDGEPMPDLSPVQATNGKVGYAYSRDMMSDKSTIPVYLSDGETVIGEFRFGDQ